MATRSLRVAALVLAAGWGDPQDAVACTCAGVFTLESSYERSANVFSAVVTDQYIEPADAQTPIRSTFRVTERFKGSPPFQAFVHDGMCGINLEIGVEYLFFVSDSGHIGLCSGALKTEEAEPEISALKSFRSGEHSALEEPWHFDASKDECILVRQFRIGDGYAVGALAIGAWRPPIDPQQVPDFAAAELNIRMGNGAAPGGAPEQVHLTLDGVTYTLTWKVREVETDEGQSLKMPGSYELGEHDAEDVLRRLPGSEALTIRLDGEGFGPDLHIDVGTANLADGAEKMLACIQSFR